MRPNLKILTGTSNPELAQGICRELSKILSKETSLIPTNITHFPNGELYAQVLENVRGCDVFVVQSLHCKFGYSLIEETELLIDCIRDSARRITIIAPWVAYAKQDRKTKPRETRSFRTICHRLSKCGAHRVLLCDIHNSATAGFFNIAYDLVYIMRILIEEMQRRNISDPLLGSPDLGSSKRVNAISNITGINDVCIVQKIRNPNTKKIDVAKSKILGDDVSGRNVQVFDDMIQSFSTMKTALEIIKNAGAKKITLYVVHPDFTEGAIEKMISSPADEIIVTNTIPIPKDLPSKIKVLDASEFLAQCILRIHQDGSLSDMFLQD